MNALQTAIIIWRRGENIPLTLAVALMEQGYIVSKLEQKYAR